MKSLITLTLLMLSLNAHAESNTREHLQAQANQELAGTASSCFKGLVAQKNSQMQEDYGGRYYPEVKIQLIDTGSTGYRAPAKYCAESENDQRTCDTTDTNTYLASALFSAATSGSHEVEAIVFKVQVERRTILVVKKDADYFPEPQDIISEKTMTTIRCVPVKL